MLDKVLSFAVIAGPIVFAVVIEVVDKRVRTHRFWKFGVVAFGVALSSLTWCQISRQAAAATVAQQNAVEETTKTVTKSVSKDFQVTVTNLTNQISVLKDQLAKQGKQVDTISASNIVTGKSPVKVQVVNPPGQSESGETPPEIHAAEIPAVPNPRAGKHGIQFVITTNKVMTDARVRIRCSAGTIKEGFTQTGSPGATLGGGVADSHTYISGITEPTWSPNMPLLVTLYYDSDSLGACQFKLLM